MGRSFLTIVGGFVHQAAFLLLQRPPVRGKVKTAQTLFHLRSSRARHGRMDRGTEPRSLEAGEEGWNVKVRTQGQIRKGGGRGEASPGL